MPASDWPVQRNPVTGCWEWTAKRDKLGYARTRDNKLAYRVVYEAEVGSVPEGKQPDHRCRVRACCAPYHLEPVSKSENERRKRWGYRVRHMNTCHLCGRDLKKHGRRTMYGGIICRVCSGV